jgi:anti-sigma factor ChrR (cupin superfamily)
MDAVSLNADRSQPALVDGRCLRWVASPEAGVERLLLERDGGEVARATSIVRYAPGSRFPSHRHELGEEFLVLEGTFSDERGDYPCGTYVRNPPGSAHAPSSADGCVIFVKLRQMSANDTQRCVVPPSALEWASTPVHGVRRARLYASHRERVVLENLAVGVACPAERGGDGAEILVVAGTVQLDDDDATDLCRWSWLRHPGYRRPGLRTKTGATLWIKQEHAR